MTQRIPHPFRWNDPGKDIQSVLPISAMASIGFVSFKLNTDSLLFVAQLVNTEPPMRTISAYTLCAPEVSLGAEYGTKANVWSLGCMVCPESYGSFIYTTEDADL